MVVFHHVNLGVPPGGIDPERDFLVDVLGYRPLPVPEELHGRNVNWFGAADGSQVHLSEDPDHRAAARVHVAVVVGDGLDDVVTKLRGRGAEVEVFEGFGSGRVATCRDPAGNRWELRTG